jgi:hypothetical protein
MWMHRAGSGVDYTERGRGYAGIHRDYFVFLRSMQQHNSTWLTRRE